MTHPAIIEAARLLREDAESMKESHSNILGKINWLHHREAKAYFDQHNAAADALEAMTSITSKSESASQSINPKLTENWEDKRIQIVYELLCSLEVPPADQHWEGWVAKRIVNSLAAQPVAKLVQLTTEEIIEIANKTRTGEPGTNGYILPISFARAIEAAHGITGGRQP